jgi:hypothetical protein
LMAATSLRTAGFEGSWEVTAFSSMVLWANGQRSPMRTLFTGFAVPLAGDQPPCAKKPIQEPTQADLRRHPATPGACRGWSSAH